MTWEHRFSYPKLIVPMRKQLLDFLKLYRTKSCIKVNLQCIHGYIREVYSRMGELFYRPKMLSDGMLRFLG